MKKILSFVLALTLVMSMSVLAQVTSEDIKPHLTVDTVEGAPGEVVSVSVRISAAAPVNNAIVNLSFNDEVLEYQKYASASDRADCDFQLIQASITENDSSCIGAIFMNTSPTKTTELSGGVLLKFRFKIKEDAKAGENAINIVKVNTAVLDENDNNVSCEEFTAEAGAVVITGSETEETKQPEAGDEDATEENPDDATEENTDNGTNESKDEGNKGTNTGVTTPITVVDKEEKPENSKEETAAPEFTDLAGYEWAADYIMPLASSGIIKGTSETTFAPGNNITRADFMVLLTRLLELTGNKTESFSDVPADAYFAQAVATAKEMGIAKGSDNMFSPYSSITREDMCVLVYRALTQMAYLPVIPKNNEFEGKYGDIADISDYAVEAMRELSANGIIAGSDGKVNPKGNATRAETAVIMYRIQQLIPQI